MAGVARPRRLLDHLGFGVGGDDAQADAGEPRRNAQVPEDRQRIRFFARGTADAPTPQLRLAFRDHRCGQLGQYDAFQVLEDGAITVETRYWNATGSVQNTPFLRV